MLGRHAVHSRASSTPTGETITITIAIIVIVVAIFVTTSTLAAPLDRVVGGLQLISARGHAALGMFAALVLAMLTFVLVFVPALGLRAKVLATLASRSVFANSCCTSGCQRSTWHTSAMLLLLLLLH